MMTLNHHLRHFSRSSKTNDLAVMPSATTACSWLGINCCQMFAGEISYESGKAVSSVWQCTCGRHSVIMTTDHSQVWSLKSKCLMTVMTLESALIDLYIYTCLYTGIPVFMYIYILMSHDSYRAHGHDQSTDIT